MGRQSESGKTLSGKDAEPTEGRQLDLGNKLEDCLFRLKRLTGETMAEWSDQSDKVYQRLLSALERTTGMRSKLRITDSSTQTKCDDECVEFE